MNEKNTRKDENNSLFPSKKTFRELIDRTIADAEFRKSLESNPKTTLLSMGVDIRDNATLAYLKKNFQTDHEALLADDKGNKIFAGGTIVSIVVAASTPAFPKGDE